MARARAGLLAGLTVLDLSDSIAGQFATRIMADHGAWVALVEPTAGTSTRRTGPFHADGAGSLLFWHLNGGKASIALDSADPAAWPRLLGLCADADAIVVADADLARRIEAACPHAVVGLVTDFGNTGPYAGWRGSEMIFQALSGSMSVTGAPGREPLYGVGQRASYAAGLWLYVALMAALIGRRRHGVRYGCVEVTVHEAAAAMEENFSMRWAYSRELMVRGNDPSRSVCTLECADGFAILFLRTAAGQWQSLCRIVGGEELVADARFSNWSRLSRHWFDATAELNQRTRRMNLAALIQAGEKAGLVIAVVETAASLRHEPHLAQRGFWQRVSTPAGDRLALGALFNCAEAPAIRDRAAPHIGTVDATPPRCAAQTLPLLQDAPDAPRPLSGLAVLDFTTAWAGPMATKILAVLGAGVVKIEGPHWLDSWRGPLAPTKLEQYPGKEPGPRPYNRCARFNAQNHDKRDVVLDLKTARAQELVRTMSTRMDLVVANFRPGALARMGLDYPALKASNPGLSMIEMPAVGDGPFAHRIGLGPTMEAMAGIADRIGYPQGQPLGSGSSYLDPMGALHAAAACLTTLYGRLSTGLGCRIEVAQREAAMQWIGEILLADADSGRSQPRTGNAIETACPHNAFPAAGEDSWIAIGVHDKDQWQALCRILGHPEWHADPRFADLASRLAHRTELEGLIAGATRVRDKLELAGALQAAGVPAAGVLTGEDLFADPHLRARDWYARLTHAEAGTHDYSGFPLVVSGRRYKPRRVSPLFGEHTEPVLVEYAGLTPADVAELMATGVSSTAPKSSEG